MLSAKGLTVLNLQGRIFMPQTDDPFRAADALLEGHANGPVVVDMHAEATSEKLAMGWYLDGRVSAVFGSHTHVPTADTRILPKGTAYVTDAGMAGARDSVLGFEVEGSQRGFLTGLPSRLIVEENERALILNSVLVDIDDKTRKAISIERIDREYVRG
jgi:metallophosphoesterase (TIGR00282 family)